MLRHAFTVLLFALPASGQNLVVHYELDETSGTLVSDSSGNGLDAQTVGLTSWGPGMVDGGLVLDGSTGHAAAPHHPLHDVAQLTIAAWVNADELQDWDGVLTKGTGVSPYSLMLGSPLGKFKFQANAHTPPNGVGGGVFTSTGDLTTGLWHHLAVTFDGQEVRLYLDGALDSVHPAPGIVLGNTTQELVVGCDFPGGDEYFDGALDDVRLYDGALSADEIADLFDGSVGTPYCFGDGGGSVCPCGNNGGSEQGCANSTGAGGLLGATGTSSTGADDLRFTAEQLLPGQPALLFVGNNAVGGGSGIPFGDGLRCAGMNVVRLGALAPDASGSAGWGPGLGPLGGWSAGDVRYFQVWYRDPVGGPCGSAFNLTNGVAVTFTT